MEKAYALRSAIPEIMTNGKIAVYSTLDVRVSHVVIIDDTFEWQNRAKQEVWKCGRCKTFILPDEKNKTKDGIKYHKECKPPGKAKPLEKEISNDAPAVNQSP
jgi:hypothetical protein